MYSVLLIVALRDGPETRYLSLCANVSTLIQSRANHPKLVTRQKPNVAETRSSNVVSWSVLPIQQNPTQPEPSSYHGWTCFFARIESWCEEAHGCGLSRLREFEMCAYGVPTFLNVITCTCEPSAQLDQPIPSPRPSRSQSSQPVYRDYGPWAVTEIG